MINIDFFRISFLLGLTHQFTRAHWTENNIFGPTCSGIPIEYKNVPEFHPVVRECDKEPNFCRPLCILSKLGMMNERGGLLDGKANSVIQRLLPGRLSEKACELSGAFKACWSTVSFNEPLSVHNGCSSYALILNCFRKSTLMICEGVKGSDTTKESANNPWPIAYVPKHFQNSGTGPRLSPYGNGIAYSRQPSGNGYTAVAPRTVGVIQPQSPNYRYGTIPGQQIPQGQPQVYHAQNYGHGRINQRPIPIGTPTSRYHVQPQLQRYPQGGQYKNGNFNQLNGIRVQEQGQFVSPTYQTGQARPISQSNNRVPNTYALRPSHNIRTSFQVRPSQNRLQYTQNGAGYGPNAVPAPYVQNGAGYGQNKAGYVQSGAGYGQNRAGYGQNRIGPIQNGAPTQMRIGVTHPRAGYTQQGTGYGQAGFGRTQHGARYVQSGPGHTHPAAGYTQAGYGISEQNQQPLVPFKTGPVTPTSGTTQPGTYKYGPGQAQQSIQIKSAPASSASSLPMQTSNVGSVGIPQPQKPIPQISPLVGPNNPNGLINQNGKLSAQPPSTVGQTIQNVNGKSQLTGNNVGQAPPTNVGQGPPMNVPQGSPTNVGLGPQTKTGQGLPSQGPPTNVGQGPPSSLGQRPPAHEGQGPPTSLGQKPSTNVGQGPPTSLGQRPPAHEGQGPSTSLGQKPSTNVGQGPPTSLGQRPPTNEGQGSPTSLGQKPPAHEGQASPSLGQKPSTNVGQGPPTSLGQRPPTNEGQGPPTSLGQRPPPNVGPQNDKPRNGQGSPNGPGDGPSNGPHHPTLMQQKQNPDKSMDGSQSKGISEGLEALAKAQAQRQNSGRTLEDLRKEINAGHPGLPDNHPLKQQQNQKSGEKGHGSGGSAEQNDSKNIHPNTPNKSQGQGNSLGKP